MTGFSPPGAFYALLGHPGSLTFRSQAKDISMSKKNSPKNKAFSFRKLLSKKIYLSQTLALALLAVFPGAIWGYGIEQGNLFPSKIIYDTAAFVRGHPDDHRSIWKRLVAEIRYTPSAFPANSKSTLVSKEDLKPLEEAQGLMSE
jgi:hypothetical protein